MTHPHQLLRFPHPARCADCYELQLCNCCGRPALSCERCDNGRCRLCHRRVCSPGVLGARPHGAGTIGGAELQARSRENGGELPAVIMIPDERVASAVCQRLVFLGRQFSCEQRSDGWHFAIDMEESA